MTKPAAFRQDDLTRALKAAKAAGYNRVELEPGGKIVMVDAPAIEIRGEPVVNPWDKDLESDAPPA